MRTPWSSDPADLDVAVFGVPFDLGTSNRPGARFGPRGIREESVMIRPYNMATRAAPFDSLRIDDVGDVATNAFDKNDSIARIEAFIDDLLQHDLVTVAMGGDHTLPFLTGRWPRSTARWAWCASMPIPTSTTTCSARRSPTARLSAAPSKRDCSMVIRLSESVSAKERAMRPTTSIGREQGFQVVQVENGMRSLEPLMAEVREQVAGGPVYLSFDIDGLDPAYAPGTGTLEIGGLHDRPGSGDRPRVAGA